MKLKDYIINLIRNYDLDTEIYYGMANDKYCEPTIDMVDDIDTEEYYYRIIGK